MENGKQPISPVEGDNDFLFGLTKREYFAGLAMQGILSCSNKAFGGYGNNEKLCNASIRSADELLKQLEKSE
jgi:hypothetical protein